MKNNAHQCKPTQTNEKQSCQPISTATNNATMSFVFPLTNRISVLAFAFTKIIGAPTAFSHAVLVERQPQHHHHHVTLGRHCFGLIKPVTATKQC
jgi:hypothetical protein